MSSNNESIKRRINNDANPFYLELENKNKSKWKTFWGNNDNRVLSFDPNKDEQNAKQIFDLFKEKYNSKKIKNILGYKRKVSKGLPKCLNIYILVDDQNMNDLSGESGNELGHGADREIVILKENIAEYFQLQKVNIAIHSYSQIENYYRKKSGKKYFFELDVETKQIGFLVSDKINIIQSLKPLQPEGKVICGISGEYIDSETKKRKIIPTQDIYNTNDFFRIGNNWFEEVFIPGSNFSLFFRIIKGSLYFDSNRNFEDYVDERKVIEFNESGKSWVVDILYSPTKYRFTVYRSKQAKTVSDNFVVSIDFDLSMNNDFNYSNNDGSLDKTEIATAYETDTNVDTKVNSSLDESLGDRGTHKNNKEEIPKNTFKSENIPFDLETSLKPIYDNLKTNNIKESKEKVIVLEEDETTLYPVLNHTHRIFPAYNGVLEAHLSKEGKDHYDLYFAGIGDLVEDSFGAKFILTISKEQIVQNAKNNKTWDKSIIKNKYAKNTVTISDFKLDYGDCFGNLESINNEMNKHGMNEVYSLVVDTEPDVSNKYGYPCDLMDDLYIIGRGKSNSIIEPHIKLYDSDEYLWDNFLASRFHAIIQKEKDGIYIYNISSNYPILVFKEDSPQKISSIGGVKNTLLEFVGKSSIFENKESKEIEEIYKRTKVDFEKKFNNEKSNFNRYKLEDKHIIIIGHSIFRFDDSSKNKDLNEEIKKIDSLEKEVNEFLTNEHSTELKSNNEELILSLKNLVGKIDLVIISINSLSTYKENLEQEPEQPIADNESKRIKEVIGEKLSVLSELKAKLFNMKDELSEKIIESEVSKLLIVNVNKRITLEKEIKDFSKNELKQKIDIDDIKHFEDTQSRIEHLIKSTQDLSDKVIEMKNNFDDIKQEFETNYQDYLKAKKNEGFTKIIDDNFSAITRIYKTLINVKKDLEGKLESLKKNNYLFDDEEKQIGEIEIGLNKIIDNVKRMQETAVDEKIQEAVLRKNSTIIATYLKELLSLYHKLSIDILKEVQTAGAIDRSISNDLYKLKENSVFALMDKITLVAKDLIKYGVIDSSSLDEKSIEKLHEIGKRDVEVKKPVEPKTSVEPEPDETDQEDDLDEYKLEKKVDLEEIGSNVDSYANTIQQNFEKLDETIQNQRLLKDIKQSIYDKSLKEIIEKIDYVKATKTNLSEKYRQFLDNEEFLNGNIDAEEHKKLVLKVDKIIENIDQIFSVNAEKFYSIYENDTIINEKLSSYEHLFANYSKKDKKEEHVKNEKDSRKNEEKPKNKKKSPKAQKNGTRDEKKQTEKKTTKEPKRENFDDQVLNKLNDFIDRLNGFKKDLDESELDD